MRTTVPTPVTGPVEGSAVIDAIRWIFPPGIARITPLAGPSTVVGRDKSSTPPLQSDEVSKLHARLEVRADRRVTIVDNSSKNGVFVNGRKVTDKQLAIGDVVRLGDHVGLVGRYPADGFLRTDLDEWALGDGRTIWGGPELALAVTSARRLAEGPLLRCIVLEGPSGSGKDALAGYFHHMSRSSRPLIKVDCAALGAGGLAARMLAADGGTLFLDEVAALASRAQDHLLRAIERPRGASAPAEGYADVRFVLGTRRPLAAFVQEGALRPDVRARLEQAVIRVPSLRERIADIPALVQKMIARERSGEAVRLDAKLVELLCLQEWPGNVRELENHVKGLLVLKQPGEALSRRHARTLRPDMSETPDFPAQDSARPPQPRSAPATKDTPMKILFLAANPVSMNRLALDEEVREIGARLRRVRQRDHFVLQPALAVRTKEIIETIQWHEPTVVHFGGHGNEGGELVFLGQNGEASPAPIQALTEIFRVLAPQVGIRCVVLNACFSEPQARAISEHVDCVVGMSRAVSDAAAIEFASQLYSSLGFGAAVQDAFDLARAQLELSRIMETDRPRLLSRAGVNVRDWRLVDPRAP
jgi:hypothetical protein